MKRKIFENAAIWAVYLVALILGWFFVRELRSVRFGDPSDERKTPPVSAVIYSNITVVDMEGVPLAGLTPIATDTPNAFNPPVVSGPASDANGETKLELPRNLHLFIRAWDAELRYFATNYVEILPLQTGNESEPVRIVMAPGASISGAIEDANGAPIADASVEVMLRHAELGDWWPAQTSADSAGKFSIESLPPGPFSIEVSTPMGAATLSEMMLQPGGLTDIGVLRVEQ